MIRAAELRYILIKYKHLINPNNLLKKIVYQKIKDIMKYVRYTDASN